MKILSYFAAALSLAGCHHDKHAGEEKGARAVRPQRLRIRVQLVNAAGDVIWEETKAPVLENPAIKAIAVEVLRDLEQHVRRSESVRK